METLSSIRIILILGGLLVLIMFALLKNNGRPAAGRSPTTALATAGIILVFAQMMALVLSLIMGPEGVIQLSLYCDIIGLSIYAGIIGATKLASRWRRPFHQAQFMELAGSILGAASGASVASLLLGDDLWDTSGLFGFGNLLMIAGILGGAMVIGAIRMFYNVRLYTERQQREYELLDMRRQRTAAQLQSIQARINPHFLYNALNSIAALAHEDADRTERMTLALSRLLRESLQDAGSYQTTIRHEIELVRTYLEIEEARFGENLAYSLEIDEDALDIEVPRFLLQPLVENAIKHGVSRQVGQGHVVLRIRKKDGELRISVADDGPAFPDELVGGYGWQSVSESLELLYPGRYDLRIMNGVEKQVQIRLRTEA